MTEDSDDTVLRPEATPTLHQPRAAASARDARQFTPGTTLGGRYRIVSILGRGGMGEVYRADDLKLGQTVALKFLSRVGLPASESALYDEVRLGRQISHPNICRLYDIAELDGHIFITMEFVDGEDLASLLRRVGRLPSEKAAGIARDLCGGLAAAHEKGIIHRDLKPGNVMIDGRGRARITDFGLATPEQAARNGTAGTPAYMSPEQLAGMSASIKSDLYALGAVLYETFTGRRPYEATSMSDLAAQQLQRELVRPSLVVRDVEPAIERLILHCLEPDPERRPASALDVMRELPEADPLAAAVAAGETPSPAMVAAAAKVGDLQPLTAASLLAAAILGTVAVAWLSGRAMLYRQLPVLKSPEVLLEKAREIIAGTGAAGRAADSSYVYFTDRQHLASLEARRWRNLRDEPIAPILFLYRQSPRPMTARNAERLVVTQDPPLVVSGMADVTLDAAGRLIEFVAVPPQREERDDARKPPGFSGLLAAAGFDASTLKPATPLWAAPVDSDEKRAWLATGGSMELRIEAAAYHGLPVWFAVIEPWREPSNAPRRSQTAVSTASFAANAFFLIALPTCAILLARRNLRRKRGDRRGAMRVASFMFVCSFVIQVLRAHHTISFFEEWMMISRFFAEAVFWAAIAWVIYVAVEPLARRRWPEMLISWTRLLAGGPRDPMVGRDVLVGVVAGLAVIIAWQLTAVIPSMLGQASPPPLQMVSTTLGEIRHALFYLGRSLSEAILRAIGMLTLLLILRVILRSQVLAVVMSGLLLAISFLVDATGSVPIRLAYGVLAATIALFVLLRFGLLSVMALATVVVILRSIPLTLDPGAWYFGRSSVALAVVLGLAAYGFLISTAGRALLPKLAFDP